MAVSLSSGDAAIADQYDATSIAAQIIAGDTTDDGFDIVAVSAYPLDGGKTDFIAFETLRDHGDGAIFRAVELYHRDLPAAPWRATVKVFFNDNIDLPQLQLHSNGGHLLSESQMESERAQPSTIAGNYASAMNKGAASGKLPTGTFASSVATTGAIEAASNFLSQAFANGTGSVQWSPNPGGQAVALTNGIMIFASVQEKENVDDKHVGTTFYFNTQDNRRITFGGLLAPGEYTDVRQTFLVDIAVVLPRHGLPDVVAEQSTAVAVTGTPAPISAASPPAS